MLERNGNSTGDVEEWLVEAGDVGKHRFGCEDPESEIMVQEGR